MAKDGPHVMTAAGLGKEVGKQVASKTVHRKLGTFSPTRSRSLASQTTILSHGTSAQDAWDTTDCSETGSSSARTGDDFCFDASADARAAALAYFGCQNIAGKFPSYVGREPRSFPDQYPATQAPSMQPPSTRLRAALDGGAPASNPPKRAPPGLAAPALGGRAPGPQASSSPILSTSPVPSKCPPKCPPREARASTSEKAQPGCCDKPLKVYMEHFDCEVPRLDPCLPAKKRVPDWF